MHNRETNIVLGDYELRVLVIINLCLNKKVIISCENLFWNKNRVTRSLQLLARMLVYYIYYTISIMKKKTNIFAIIFRHYSKITIDFRIVGKIVTG